MVKLAKEEFEVLNKEKKEILKKEKQERAQEFSEVCIDHFLLHRPPCLESRL